MDPTVIKVPDQNYELSLNVFPNPTTMDFTAVAEPSSELSQLSVYDMNGALMKTIRPREQSAQGKISVSEFENGVYVVAATYKNGRVTSERLIVQN